MTREIELSRGFVALVDDDDYDWLMRGGKWHASVGRRQYAIRTRWIEKRSTVQYMHCLILPTPNQVDHINGDSLDNRKENLRPATASQNAQNRRRRSDNGSGYKGVGRSVVENKPWLAAITVNGKSRHLGVFKDPIEAAKAYDAAAIAHHGEFARLNFPEEKTA